MLKRITAFLTAAVMLLPCAACSTSAKKKGATLEVDLSTSFVGEKFTKNGIKYEPKNVTEKGVICTKFDRVKVTHLALCDPETGEWRDFNKNQTNLPEWAGLLPDGRFAAVYNKVLGVSGTGYQYDEKQRIIEIYDDDLNVAEQKNLPTSFADGILEENNLIADNEGCWYFLPYTDEDLPDGMEVYSPDFKRIGKISLDNTNIFTMAVGHSGAVYAIVSVQDSMQLCRFNKATMTAELLDKAIPYNVRYIAQGPDYELYYSTRDGIYGLSEDMTSTLLLDYRNSDLPDLGGQFWPLPGGEFLLQDGTISSQPQISRMRRRTAEELQGMQIVTLAGVNLPNTLVSHVCDFNREHTDMRIVMKDYADVYKQNEQDFYRYYSEDPMYYVYTGVSPASLYPEAVDAFKNDLMAGIVPDIICMDCLPYQQLSNKGLLTDIWPLLEQDERFNEQDYFMHFIDGLKEGDKLERIGFTYIVDTAIAKTALVGAQQGRTPEEYTAMIEQIPEGMDLVAYQSQEYLTDLYLVGSQSTFIDRGTMTCHFNDESFVKLLEMTAKAKPAGKDIELTEAERQEEEADYYRFWDARRLLVTLTLYAPYQYHGIHYGDFRGEDITLVGYPETAGGNGGRYKMNYLLSLTAQSAMQEPVMEYFLYELSPIRQNKAGLSTSTQAQTIPLHRDAFENYLKAANITTPFQSGASEEEMKIVREYIAGIRTFAEEDPAVNAIIYEEAAKFFSGDQTAQQAADMIQSRCSLYLSEQQ